MNSYIFGYRGFELHCAPILMEEGGFNAQVIIESMDGATRLTQQLPYPSIFNTIDGAVAHAREWSMRRVDEEIRPR